MAAGISFSMLGAFALFAAIAFGMWGCPQYNVYSSRLSGEAELAHAEYSKRVQVQEAEGRLAAAEKLAQVEIARAGGVAKANQIIGESLKNNEAYLRYLWITDLTANQKSPTVIYVPTEANIPILEAGRTLTQPASK